MPKWKVEAVRIVDMSASNSWAEFADLFRSTHGKRFWIMSGPKLS